MKWITRERPKIDRLACPWLIKRFIDAKAEIIYVPAKEVIAQAKALQAIPFDVPDVEFSHYEDRCTFDYFIEKYNLKDAALHTMALAVRGADTDNHSISSQSAGLWAISAGLAFNFRDDYELLERGMLIYDALYSWAKYLQNETHTQNPTESLLQRVLHQHLAQEEETHRKMPDWGLPLKKIIQDQIDRNLVPNLTKISEELDLHPAYLSRQFPKYFDSLTFGEYIRKLRIEKAIHLLYHTSHSLSEIAYLVGFSDQSHFSRMFKSQTGVKPSNFRKGIIKGKEIAKG
ncbi:helix-turn-helix domain-containing protein [Pontibacter qinzhouensis]|uniref:Helix-turn-helix domain-containing protein n=1 Tax=Pontibacter qinzhouensis TaxID=2603253 RepID=A0A5C8KB29_9BACT|nr:chromate resistance protein ChrB domain-containing protein [Pontibacter qinzhouensis]TXK50037.1 helix-turn-helix domain-containing protein [Pontibacter qinzhouensis]